MTSPSLSEKDGYFSDLMASLVATLTPEEASAVPKLASDAERVAHVASLPFFRNNVRITTELWRGKDEAVARERREAGNIAFEAGKLTQAHLLYSISILHAPVTLKDRLGEHWQGE